MGGPCNTPPQKYITQERTPKMILIRKGFDGLDISYPLMIGEEVAAKMRAARQAAESDSTGQGGFLNNGVRMQFVAHASSRVQEISDDLVNVVGRSGRVESVTIGKNPQRQVVVYDTRAEVIATGKSYWWPIWDGALAEQRLPPLDRHDRAPSSVWRVEIRAFKRHLKDTWGVTTWGHLREQPLAIQHHALCDVRFVTLTTDTNRAHWPKHPLWTLA